MPTYRSGYRAVCFSLVGLMIFLSGCSLLPREEEVLQPPLIIPQQESYNLHEVKRGTATKQIRGTGTFESTNVVYQQFEGAAGKIQAIHAQVGDTVEKGTPLLELNNEGLDIVLLERERDLELAKRALEQSKESRDTQLMKIRLLEYEIARKRMDDARGQMEGTIMAAQIDGVIVQMEQVALGDPVQAGKTYVVIADPASIRLAYSGVISSELQEVEVGMKAEITYRNETIEGYVTQSPSSAPATDNKELADKYARTIYFQLEDSDIVPELNANADIAIILQQREDVILIVRNAVHTLLGRTYVKVLEGESVREVDVQLGLESISGVEVVKGLEEGQMLILQ